MPDLIRDTSPQADAIRLQILRQMPPARRGELATSLSRTVLTRCSHSGGMVPLSAAHVFRGQSCR
jgi:hypothetical protein